MKRCQNCKYYENGKCYSGKVKKSLINPDHPKVQKDSICCNYEEEPNLIPF